MRTFFFSKPTLIQLVLWVTVIFSAQALIFHVRWFVPYLLHHKTKPLYGENIPGLWFLVQISTNLLFLIVGVLLIRLFRNYRRTGFFDHRSLRVFNTVIMACVALALIGSIQTVANQFEEVQWQSWTSIEAIANLTLRAFTTLLVFKEPQTMYFLLAIMLWAVKQFVAKALVIKNEHESFI